MKKIFFVLMILVPFAGLFAQQDYEPGVILLQVRQPEVVRFSNGEVINGSPQLQAVFQQYRAIRVRKLSHVNYETDGCYRVEFPVDFPLTTIRDALANCPDIKYINLAYYGVLCGEPNDTLWDYQWALEKIQMPDAWDVTKPNSTILVGIMDTGLDYTHEDLVDNIWTNPNEAPGDANGDGYPGIRGVDDDNDGLIDEDSQGRQPGEPGYTNDLKDDDDENGYADDFHGWDFRDKDNDPQESGLTHGTRVAGVIAARTYNGIGVAGIAGGWQSQVGVRLIGLRIAGFDGWTQDRAKLAIDYLTWLRQQYGYTIIANMSFQTRGIDDEPMDMLDSSIVAAKEAGVIMVAAAGNVQSDSKSPYNQPEVETLPIPARYGGVLAIGASKDGETLQNEERSPYSLYDIEDRELLVVAPVDDHVISGINIYTTYPNNDYINWFNGTSAACPIAVGVVSLMLSVNPSLNYWELSNIFKHTAEKIGPYTYYGYPGRTNEVGHGRINTYQALLMALAYDNKIPNISPTVYNNQRILARGKNNTNHLYEVFYSGTTNNWEVFFRKSTDNGSSWGTPVRISAGDLNNRYRSLVEWKCGLWENSVSRLSENWNPNRTLYRCAR